MSHTTNNAIDVLNNLRTQLDEEEEESIHDKPLDQQEKKIEELYGGMDA